MTTDTIETTGAAFDEASRAMIAAIPADVTTETEAVMIEAAAAPVALLAERIIEMGAVTPEGEAIRQRAAAWLDGR